VFVTVSHYHPSTIFSSKAGAYPSGASTGEHFKSRHLALLANIRLVRKRLQVTNTLAYYHNELITTIISFIAQAQTLYSLRVEGDVINIIS
jgi:hypothetical protein